MTIDLKTFASGDTDYIAKLNANIATLTDEISQMQAQIGAIAGTDQVSIGMFLNTLFNHRDGLIGVDSYTPTQSGTTLTVAPGGAYLAAESTTVASLSNTPLNFVTKPADTYYVVITEVGTPMLMAGADQSTPGVPDPGSVYSQAWTGTAFSGTPVRLVPIFFDTAESEAARQSTALSQSFHTLDKRLEADESWALGETPVRKVGVTVDGTTGLKGAIQVDFDGTIIGWSVMANVAGDLTVEVSKKGSSAPPSNPAIPSPTTDKISASAPIRLSSAQSATSAAAGVSTWTTHVNQWDVIQFNVASVNTISRATLYIRIQEFIPSPP